MDEAKSLFHMSISAMFAALLLGAITAILGVSYLMWSYFARQDAASAKMTQYSNLTAFDNTTIRGSEVESLLTYADNLGVYVAFYDSASTATHLNDQTSLSNLRYIYANPRDSAYNIITNTGPSTNIITTCKTAETYIKNQTTGVGTGSECYPAKLGVTNLYNLPESTKHRDLVALLTSPSALGDPNQEGNYGVFKSTLVYSGDSTGDVACIVLVRASANIAYPDWE